jgi:hypothetical protein
MTETSENDNSAQGPLPVPPGNGVEEKRGGQTSPQVWPVPPVSDGLPEFVPPVTGPSNIDSDEQSSSLSGHIMPTTIFALAVIVVLVLPGFVFANQVQSQVPVRNLSPLKEFATIAGVGLICDSFVLLIFGIIRALFPHSTPDVGDIERGGITYVRSHFVSTGWWFIGLFLASCMTAYALGKFRPQIVNRVEPGRIVFNSAWWELFYRQPNHYKYIGCYLRDDSYVAGYLMRFSPEADESHDRDLALSAPVSYHPVGGTNAIKLSNVDAAIINAGQIKFLTVTYTKRHPTQPLTPTREADAEARKAKRSRYWKLLVISVLALTILCVIQYFSQAPNIATSSLDLSHG